MTICRTQPVELGSVFPQSVSRKAPTWTVIVEADWADLDCDGGGVTIISSTWQFASGGTGAMLTNEVIDGLVTKVIFAGGTEGELTHLENTVTASDGTILTATVTVPIESTRIIQAA